MGQASAPGLDKSAAGRAVWLSISCFSAETDRSSRPANHGVVCRIGDNDAHPGTRSKSLGASGPELGSSKWITYILYALDDDAMWSWRTGN